MNLYENNTRTHTLALRENSFRDKQQSRIFLGFRNPKKDTHARRARNPLAGLSHFVRVKLSYPKLGPQAAISRDLLSRRHQACSDGGYHNLN